MPQLTPNSPLQAVTDVLQNARVMGRCSWDTVTGSTTVADPSVESVSRDAVRALFGELHSRKVPYALVGGIALLCYIDGRNTEDVDLILSVKALPSLPELEITDQNPHFARGRFKGLRVDLLFTAHPLFQAVLDQYTATHRFLETDVRVATVAGLVLLKLFALPSLYRQGQRQRAAIYETDIMLLIMQHPPDMTPIWDELSKHLETAVLDDLRSVADDIARRIDRLNRAGPTTP